MTNGWIVTWEGVVESDWLDELGHVNFLIYQRVADHGSLELWKRLSGNKNFKARAGMEFVMTETQVRYFDELRLGDAIQVQTALCAFDDKRFQFLHKIVGPNGTAAMVETVNLSFHLPSRRVQPFTPEVQSALQEMGPPPFDANPDLHLKRKRPTP